MDTRNGRTRKALELKQAAQFFYDNAGYGYDPKKETAEQGKKRCALQLARAERGARKRFYSWEWINEDSRTECIGCGCGNEDCACSSKRPHDCYVCILRNADGESLASLGSICEPSTEYRRVIEAQLALEAL